jgi:predicted regulator of Ras-like GTPase activity (Roadblock/LC7/MglB family)
MIQELATKLSKIDGVDGVVIAARDGIVLAHELNDASPDKEGAVAVFVGNAASQASESLALGPFDWGTVTIGNEVVLVMEQPDYYVGLLLADRASPAIVASSAREALG